jgi:hypothetical protein
MKTCEYCNSLILEKYGSGRFCSSKCSRGFSTRDKRSEINLKTSITIKNRLKKGETIGFCNPVKEEKRIVCLNCNEIFCSKKDRKYCSNKCKNESPIYREKIGKSVKGKTGGIKKGSGTGKSGRYKGIWCDSTYELIWVIYNLDHYIKFERNKNGYDYYFNGKKHKYYPDFLKGEELIEIKGFIRENDRIKFESVKDKKLTILFKKDLDKEFNYVIQKYGKDFISLYEK